MADARQRIVAEIIARDRATRVFSGFNRSLLTTTRSLRRMATGVLALAGIAGIGYMIKQQMAAIDATAKLSDRLGIATEALVGLQHGASIAGVQQETLNKSLEIFSRRLGEVDMGVGQATYALDKLGLNYKDLIGLDMAEAFSIIADQIKGLATQSEKAAAANYLFGRSGQQLLNLFEEGSAGIEEFRKEAEKLGITFDRIDAAKIEAANDALTRTRAVFTGLFRTATIELAPYIEAASTAFNDWATSGEGVGVKISNSFEQMSLAALKFGELMNILPGYWKAFEAAAHESLATIYEILDAATNLDVLFKKLKMPKWEYTYKELAEQQRQIAEGLLEAGGADLAKAMQAQSAVEKFYDDLRKREAKWRDVYEEADRPALPDIEGAADLTDKEMAEVVKSTRNAIDSIRHLDYLTRMERIENLRAYAAENAATLEEVTEAENLLSEEIKNIQRSRLDAAKVYHAELREDFQNLSLYMSEKYTDAFKTMESEGSGFFFNTMKDASSWRDHLSSVFSNIGDSFARMASDMLMRWLMLKAMGLFFGGPAAGVGGAIAPGAHGGMHGMGYALGGIFERGQAVPFAAGDIIDRPTYFPMAGGRTGLMGEKGPEVILPLAPGAGGKLGVQASQPNINFQPNMKIVIVRNEREAQIEAMNSDEGEKVIVRKVIRNRNVLG